MLFENHKEVVVDDL